MAMRSSRTFAHLEILWKDSFLTSRSLGKERAFSLLSIALLALGLGVASAVFTLLWQAIYARLPVPDPAQVFTFSTNVTHMGRSESDAQAMTFSAPMYRYLATHMKIATGIVARHGERLNIDTAEGARHLLADFVTGNFFQVLGIKPAMGRAIEQANDAVSDERFVAVLSFDFWQEAYAGQISAWNSLVRINGIPFRIIGVAPRGFQGLIAGQAPKLYLPLATYADLNPGWHGYDDWALRWVNTFTRLPEGASRSTTEAELQPVYRAAVREELANQSAQSSDYLKELSHEHVSLIPASRGVHSMLDKWGEPLRILQAMTLAVLLLAAINVAGLMLVRGIKQKQEIVIRYAVGATRRAVMRLQLLQALVLSVAGGALAILIARWGSQLLVHLARMDQGGAFIYHPYGSTLALHWIAAIFTGLLVGFFPAWQAARMDLAAGLNEGALTHSGTRSQALSRRSLAAVQIALSVVLAVAASLFAEALHKLVRVPVGFNPQHLTVFSVDAKLAHSTLENSEALWSNIAQRLSGTPGVQAVTYGTGGPFPQGADAAVVIPGVTSAAISKHQSGIRSIVGPHYFSTLGIPIVQGRQFDERDRRNTSAVIVINQTMARKLFGNGNPVGKTVTMFNGIDPNWIATIVGVAADHHQSWLRHTASLVYTPAQQVQRITDITYYVRTAASSLPEHTIRNIVNAEAPTIAAYDVATMQSRMAEFASGERAMALLLGAFAGLAMLIAGIGIYGVIAYGSSARTVEFGIRVSVGATPSDVAWLVLREAVWILLSGLALAAPLTWFALIMVRTQIAGLSLAQPAIYGLVVLLIAACTFAAASVPALRATRLSLHEALRHS